MAGSDEHQQLAADAAIAGRPAIVDHRPGPGRFVTTLILEDLEGVRTVWHSRRNRKGLDAQPPHAVRQSRPRQLLVFAPQNVCWWIGTLFMIGAGLFGIGSIAPVLRLAIASGSATILFIGSLFFTSAAYLQLFEVVNEPTPETGRRPPRVLFRSEPQKIGWWAALIQFIGTLLFNVNTFEATRALSPLAEEAFVWGPNAVGSICFLVASYLAYAEVCRHWIGFQPRNVSWWIVVINLLGSVAFGASAVASIVRLPSAELLDESLANVTTFAGAVCFFIAAYLLWPEMTAQYAPRPGRR